MGRCHPRKWNPEDAQAHPIWVSPLFEVPKSLRKVWESLELRAIKDTFLPDGSEYSDDMIVSYFEDKYEQSSTGDFYIRPRTYEATRARSQGTDC